MILDEENLSAEKEKKEEGSWISEEDEDSRRAQNHPPQENEGAKGSLCIIYAKKW